MSTNETVHVSATGGQKAGNDERYDLIPAEPLRRLAIHAGTVVFAARGGSYHQMMSHAWAFWAGEETDTLTDWDHLTAAAWEAFCIVQPDWRPPTWVLDDRRPGRERYDRIPPDALRQLARHFGVGAKKYDDDNWTRGYDWRLTFAAANRHAEQWRAGETHDPETGSHHLIAFAWHMLVLDEFTRINRGGDTRYCTKVRRWLDAEKRWKAIYGFVLRPPTGCQDNDPRCIGLCLHCAGGVGGADYVDPGDGAGPGEPVRQAELRVVDSLGENERDAQWTGKAGRFRWDDNLHRWTRIPAGSQGIGWIPTVCYHGHGPYTEVLPRVVETLGENERDAAWVDRDHDDWRFVAWNPQPIGDHPGVWEFRDHAHGGEWTATQAGYEPGPEHGPFTEVLA